MLTLPWVGGITLTGPQHIFPGMKAVLVAMRELLGARG